MKNLTIIIGLLLLLVCQGTAMGANNAVINNTSAAGSNLSVDLPEHSVDLPQIQSELFSLKSRVNQMEADIRSMKTTNDRLEAIGLVLILFGAVGTVWVMLKRKAGGR